MHTTAGLVRKPDAGNVTQRMHTAPAKVILQIVKQVFLTTGN